MENLHQEYRDNLEYMPEGLPGDSGPFFQVKYKWDVPREQLIPNFEAVEATRKHTLRKLEKDPAWHMEYERQLLT